MIHISEAAMADLRANSDGFKRAFIGRVGDICAAPSPTGEAVLAALGEAIAENDWPRVWRKAFASPKGVFSAVFGFSKEAIFAAKDAVRPLRMRPAQMLYPMRSRDKAAVCFAIANEKGRMSTLSVPMDIEMAGRVKPGERYEVVGGRPGRGPSILRTIDQAKDPMAEMPAHDIAGITEAQYRKLAFFGRWERDKEFDEIAEKLHYPGQRCGAYVNRETGAAFLVFEGTRASPADMVTNVAATRGIFLRQYKVAPSVVEAAAKRYPDLCIAGHSKGGGISQYAAAMTGFPCVTFNSVGLPPFEQKFNPKCTHYLIKNDPVSNLNGVVDYVKGVSIKMFSGLPQRLLPGETKVLDSGFPRSRFGALHSLTYCRETLVKAGCVVANAFKSTEAYPSGWELEGRAIAQVKGYPRELRQVIKRSRI